MVSQEYEADGVVSQDHVVDGVEQRRVDILVAWDEGVGIVEEGSRVKQ